MKKPHTVRITGNETQPWKKLLLLISSFLFITTLLAPAPASANRRPNQPGQYSSTYVVKRTAVCGFHRIDTNKKGIITLNVIYIIKVEAGGLLPLPLCEEAKKKIRKEVGITTASKLPRTTISSINMQSCSVVGGRVAFDSGICRHMGKATNSKQLAKLPITRVDGDKLLKIGAQPPFVVQDRK